MLTPSRTIVSSGSSTSPFEFEVKSVVSWEEIKENKIRPNAQICASGVTQTSDAS